MTPQANTKADPILLLAQRRDASYAAGKAALTDEASDPHFAKLWSTGLKIMATRARSIDGVAAQLQVLCYHLHDGDNESCLIFAPCLQQLAEQLRGANHIDCSVLASLTAVRDLLALQYRDVPCTPPAELAGLTNAIDALTALRMKAAS